MLTLPYEWPGERTGVAYRQFNGAFGAVVDRYEENKKARCIDDLYILGPETNLLRDAPMLPEAKENKLRKGVTLIVPPRSKLKQEEVEPQLEPGEDDTGDLFEDASMQDTKTRKSTGGAGRSKFIVGSYWNEDGKDDRIADVEEAAEQKRKRKNIGSSA